MAWVNMSPLVKQYVLAVARSAGRQLIAGVLYMSPPPEYTMNCLSIEDRKALKAHPIFRSLSRFDLASGKYFS